MKLSEYLELGRTDDGYIQIMYAFKHYDTNPPQNFIDEAKAKYTKEDGTLDRVNFVLDSIQESLDQLDPTHQYYQKHIENIWIHADFTGVLQLADSSLDLYAIYNAYAFFGEKYPDIEGLKWWYNTIPADENSSKVGMTFDMNNPFHAALINGLNDDRFTDEEELKLKEKYGEEITSYALDLNKTYLEKVFNSNDLNYALNVEKGLITQGFTQEQVNEKVMNMINFFNSAELSYTNPTTGIIYKGFFNDDLKTNLEYNLDRVEGEVSYANNILYPTEPVVEQQIDPQVALLQQMLAVMPLF